MASFTICHFSSGIELSAVSHRLSVMSLLFALNCASDEVKTEVYAAAAPADRPLSIPATVGSRAESDRLARVAKCGDLGNSEDDGVGGEEKSTIAAAGCFLNSWHERS